jgi:pyruvate dehydrogenase E1 component
MGGIAGRTTLAGEGLQHQDGHSHLLAATVPNLRAYDPAYAYELAVIIQDGLRRMYHAQEPIFYYITMYNETYRQPAMPEGAGPGILKGMYHLASRDGKALPAQIRPQLLGSGPILREVLRAQELLADEFGVGSDVWSVTSYKELRRDALSVERWNLLHPGESARSSYVEECLGSTEGPVIAASDYMRLVPEQIARWLPGRMVVLGTDGFGRSDTRDELRRHFEVDAPSITFATLSALSRRDLIKAKLLRDAARKLAIDPDRPDPAEM